MRNTKEKFKESSESLKKILENIGPYLPEPDKPFLAQSDDWHLNKPNIIKNDTKENKLVSTN